ncbi:MAG: hypothetical protein K2O18_05115 [Oscillospiraceae bacterium]|nr:hypothetical protein [Oscillospiraceae bacterium]
MSTLMLLASDAPLQEFYPPPDFDFTVTFYIDERRTEDSGRDDGFAIIPRERVLEILSEKRYYASFEWLYTYTPGRAERVIAYLKEHLKTAGEIEFWHVWQDMDFDHRVRKAEIPIDELSAEDIQELEQLEVWKEPVTDYCYVIRN